MGRKGVGMIIDDEEWLGAFTPSKNGCKFRVLQKGKEVYYDGGCNLYPNLLSGAERYMFELLEKNEFKPVKISASPSGILQILNIKTCECSEKKQ